MILTHSRKWAVLVSVYFGVFLILASCGSEQDNLIDKYQSKKGSYPINTHHLDESGEPRFINRLVKQRSLYLLQHAHNPVDWYAWGDDAFKAAKQSGKPILLSIGYSTCHWCHVMERESFENLEIADFINQHFIAIKVDREEHPAVDEIYITAVQNLSGKAGWPLTAVLTPDAKPFFGGTYFRPDQFLSLLKRINETWQQKPEAIKEQAERVMLSLNEINRSAKEAKKIDAKLIATAREKISAGLSATATPGGSAFPREPEMLFVLNQAVRNSQTNISGGVQSRLSKIANGGIHDQIGGGFHRYSVDENWQVPHFEKMLYNQAQLGEAFLLSYQLNGNARHKLIAESTFNFMLREMQSDDGGFYAAMDAETEGKEGTYYLWNAAQLMAILSTQQLKLAQEIYHVSPQGNFENSNVLQFSPENTEGRVEQLADLQKILVHTRNERPHPRIDEKIITSWNSMAISALLRAYQVIEDERYLIAASKAAERIWATAYGNKVGLARTAPLVGRNADAVLEDYAYFSKAMLDLYDVSQDEQWLERSKELVRLMMERFLDVENGAFRTSPSSNEKKLIVDMITARDDAVVSGNSMAAQAIAALYNRTGNVEYRRTVNKLLAFFSQQLQKQPQSLSGMLQAAAALTQGEIGKMQYGAKGKVKITTTVVDQQLNVTINIEKGWHINANPVLEDSLIPTNLTPIDSYCPSIRQGQYPTGKRVKLGFQTEQLVVYEDSVVLIAPINDKFLNGVEQASCKFVVAELRIQACSDEVCLEPEVVQIRATWP